MEFLESVATVVHVLVSIFLILIVLLQQGKGASMGAVFGGSSQTVFGGRGAASFLAKRRGDSGAADTFDPSTSS